MSQLIHASHHPHSAGNTGAKQHGEV